MAHFDLIIRGGTAVLPWGELAADIGVRGGRVAAIGASGTADEVVDAAGLHVLPGLIDPHVHLRDPGDPAIETIPTGTKAAVLGGLTTVFDMPNTSPSITDAERVAWKQGYVEANSWCDIGLYVGATKPNTPRTGDVGNTARRLRGQGLRRQFDWRSADRGRSQPGGRDALPAAAGSPTTVRTSIDSRPASRCSTPACHTGATWNGGTRNVRCSGTRRADGAGP